MENNEDTPFDYLTMGHSYLWACWGQADGHSCPSRTEDHRLSYNEKRRDTKEYAKVIACIKFRLPRKKKLKLLGRLK